MWWWGLFLKMKFHTEKSGKNAITGSSKNSKVNQLLIQLMDDREKVMVWIKRRMKIFKTNSLKQ